MNRENIIVKEIPRVGKGKDTTVHFYKGLFSHKVTILQDKDDGAQTINQISLNMGEAEQLVKELQDWINEELAKWR